MYGSTFAEGWNFGPKDEDAKPVQWIAEKLASQWGEKAQWLIDEGSHPHEAHFLKLDCSKARSLLGWQPVWGLEYALKRTVNWYQAWLSQVDMYAYTMTEINDYMNAQKGL